MHDMHTARDSVFKNEHTTTMATKSFDNRKLETPHPKLSSYLSTGTLSVASNVHIKTDAFLMRGIPQKDALFASKAMRESVELAKLQEERKKIARFSHAFSSIGRDRSNPHFIGVVIFLLSIENLV